MVKKNSRPCLIELRSREAQELIGKLPNGWMRHGIGGLLCLLLTLLGTCYFIPYDDSHEVPVQIWANVTPEEVRAAADGRIIRCLVNNGDTVVQADTLLLTEQGGTTRPLLASCRGYVHLATFCAADEPFRAGQLLMEVIPVSAQARYLQARLDSIPAAVSVDLLQQFTLPIAGKPMTFVLQQERQATDNSLRQALYRSTEATRLTHSQKTRVKLLSPSGNLLQQLIPVK